MKKKCKKVNYFCDLFCRLKKKMYICSALVHPQIKRGAATKTVFNK